MTPMIIHRYSIPIADVIKALIDAGDCLKIDAVLVGENLVVDVIAPAASTEDEADFAEVEEPPPAPEPPPSQPERKGGALAQKAGILCNEGAFQLWAEVRTPDAAKAFIYKRCGVDSRIDLDHEEEPAAKFRELCLEYQVWLEMPDQ